MSQKFTYELPDNFSKRVIQFLQQQNENAAMSFSNCKYEYDDVGLAYYAGLKGDNWNKNAVDFTVEGSEDDICMLKTNNIILENAIKKSLKSNDSGLMLRKIYYIKDDSGSTIDALPTSNIKRLQSDIVVAKTVLSDLIKIGERVCNNVGYNKDSSENTINDFFRDSLSLMGYNEVKDQSRHGTSATGNNAGEVDILLTKDGKEIAIFEGLKLNCVNGKYIDNHIEKAIMNYNALGTATFIVAYVNVIKYEEFWNKYLNYISEKKWEINIKLAIREEAYPNASTRIATMVVNKEGFDFPVYFLTFKINE